MSRGVGALDQLVALPGGVEVELSAATLDQWWAELRGGVALRVRAAFDDAALESLGLHDDDLHVRPGAWRINVSAAVARATLTAAALAAALEASGSHDVLVVLLAAVVPQLVDVEHVELDPADGTLLARLRAVIGPDKSATARELRSRLPRSLKRSTTVADIEALLERLFAAGTADKSGDVYVIRRAGDEAWLRISIR